MKPKRSKELQAEIDEVTEVIPNLLYLSSESAAYKPEILKKHGIKVVVACRRLQQDFVHQLTRNYKDRGVKFVFYRAPDLKNFNISIYFKDIETLMKECEDRKEPVLVHCKLGVSRSPTLVLSYLIRRMRKPLRVVYPFLIEKRKIVYPNEGFFRILIDFSSKNSPEKDETKKITLQD